MALREHLVAYLLIVAVSVSSAVIITDYSDDRNDALQIALEQKRIQALEEVCRQNVEDRKILIRSAKVQAAANQAIADDPSQADSVRRVRGVEARAQREAIADLASRLDKNDGGEADCKIE